MKTNIFDIPLHFLRCFGKRIGVKRERVVEWLLPSEVHSWFVESPEKVKLQGKIIETKGRYFERVVAILGKRTLEGNLHKDAQDSSVSFNFEFTTKSGLKFIKIYAFTSEGKSCFIGSVFLRCSKKAIMREVTDFTAQYIIQVVSSEIKNILPCKNKHIFKIEKVAKLSIQGPFLLWGYFVAESPIQYFSVVAEGRNENVVVQQYLRPEIERILPNKVSDGSGSGFFSIISSEILPDHVRNFTIVAYLQSGERLVLGKIEIEKIQTCLNFENVANLLLGFFDVSDSKIQLKLANLVQPTLLSLWRQHVLKNPDVKRHNYGELHPTPMCSIIIPLYGVSYFMRHQLIAFQNDEEIKKCEIIYVIDDPKIEPEALQLAENLSAILSISFSVIYYGFNLGYSSANNIGVQQSSGKYIVLLNSDVLPRYAGWLGKMLKQFMEKDDIGILGVRLIFPDATIQHNDMKSFINPEFPYAPFNDHPGKNIPEKLIPTQGLRECDMVTGACMLLEKNFFIKIGMLSTDYIWGDFEDSDLCSAAKENKKKIYIDDTISLYHLERQSLGFGFENSVKFKITLINGITHAKKWYNFSRKDEK